MEQDWDRVEAELQQALSEALGDRAADAVGLQLDRSRLERFAAEVRAGRLDAESNRLREQPQPPEQGDVEELDALDPAERERLSALGRAALARGEVATCVLNGGMATRFGGGVKGIVEAVDGRSFLEIKRAQARSQGPVPFLVMNSFSTHRATLEFVESRQLGDGLHAFLQSVSLRLTPDGELFRDSAGRISPYAPGHGDFPSALGGCGLLDRLLGEGVRAIALSNVDNLGADLDPLIVGYHLDRGRPMTVEVARTIPGDAGGAPARVGGHLELVEGFRFPAGFDFDQLPFVNTNSFLFDASALAEPYRLSWFYVEKQVDGRIAVQMERLVGELSVFLPGAYLAVPRHGSALRYFPVKTQQDLEALRADAALVARFSGF